MPLLQRIDHDNGVVTYRSPQLHERGVIHAFTTRIGGISRPPFDQLNLQHPARHDDPSEKACIAENFRRLRRALGVERHARIQVSQVHGCDVWVPPTDQRAVATAPSADAIVADQPERLLTIRVADCVPVLLAGPGGRAVAAIHAGWRGLVAGVLGQAVTTLADRFSIERQAIVAAVGPCIGAAHFEVGEEVAEAFEQADLADVVDHTRGPKPHVDLARAAAEQLRRHGIHPDHLDTTDRCTFTHEAELFSHRRDRGVTGRMAAVIAASA